MIKTMLACAKRAEPAVWAAASSNEQVQSYCAFLAALPALPATCAVAPGCRRGRGRPALSFAFRARMLRQHRLMRAVGGLSVGAGPSGSSSSSVGAAILRDKRCHDMTWGAFSIGFASTGTAADAEMATIKRLYARPGQAAVALRVPVPSLLHHMLAVAEAAAQCAERAGVGVDADVVSEVTLAADGNMLVAAASDHRARTGVAPTAADLLRIAWESRSHLDPTAASAE